MCPFAAKENYRCKDESEECWMNRRDKAGKSEGEAEKGSTLGRRAFMATAATAALGGSAYAQDRDYGQNAPPVRYPEPDVIALDKRFAKYKIGNTSIQRLYTGTQWAEGPAWCAAGRYLVWSDIPNNVHMRWLQDDGRVTVFHTNSNYTNGNTFDWEGRLLSCEHGTRRVVRYEHNGSVTVLADKYQGKQFNAPNDIVVHPDGGIWFTDPGYGSMGNWEGFKGDLLLKESVYRIDGKSFKTEKVIDDMFKPNGLCFSPDYKKLYVADTGATSFPEAPRNIRVYDLNGTTKVKNGREYTSMVMKTKDGEMAGLADGIRADTDGNIWVGAGWVGKGYDGVHIFTPEGERIGQILLPEICANICFGGPRRNRLFMASSQSLYAVYVEAQGAHIS
jgi:gluconolactonase